MNRHPDIVDGICWPGDGAGTSARITLLAQLEDPRDLMAVAGHYNWDDGFALPLAIVRHPHCDRGLALWLLWEVDDTAQALLEGGMDALVERRNLVEPDGFQDMCDYAATLLEGLRRGRYRSGPNRFDTGCFGEDLPDLSERQRRIRELHTRRRRSVHEDVFLQPELGPPDA